MSLDDTHPCAHGAVGRRTRRGVLDALAMRLFTPLVNRLRHGSLSIELPSGAVIGSRSNVEPRLRITVHRWRAFARLLFAGDIGFAEGYMSGDWSTPDLPSLLEFLLRNDQALASAWAGLSLSRWRQRLRHGGRANTRRGSRRNIEAHYDLGNEFYASWLDRGMNYSSALYARPGLSLEEAQAAKLNRVVSLLGVEPGSRVLEIGCGWGALAEHLAKEQRCRVTGITLSREQRAYARERLDFAGVSERSEIRLEDYRDVEGTFDAVVSIEMLEAAGEAYWPVFFQRLRQFLVPGGTAVLQVITIDESRFEDYRRRPDFIQRYIFPGGMLPTRDVIARQLAAAGLVLRSCQLFGEDYARTLVEWRARYAHSRPPADAPHLNAERFRRMWTYYLAYCEAGFRVGALDVGLYRITRP